LVNTTESSVCGGDAALCQITSTVLLPTDTDTNRLADSDNQSTLYVQDP